MPTGVRVYSRARWQFASDFRRPRETSQGCIKSCPWFNTLRDQDLDLTSSPLSKQCLLRTSGSGQGRKFFPAVSFPFSEEFIRSTCRRKRTSHYDTYKSINDSSKAALTCRAGAMLRRRFTAQLATGSLGAWLLCTLPSDASGCPRPGRSLSRGEIRQKDKTPFLVSRTAHTTRQLAGFPFRASPTASSIQGWAPGRWLITRQTTTPPLAPERF